MNLAQFIESERALLTAFEAYWKEHSAIDPEDFNQDKTKEEWVDQYWTYGEMQRRRNDDGKARIP